MQLMEYFVIAYSFDISELVRKKKKSFCIGIKTMHSREIFRKLFIYISHTM